MMEITVSDMMKYGLFFRPEVLSGNPGVMFQPDVHYHRNINIGGGSAIIDGWTNLDGNYGVIVHSEIFDRIQEKTINNVFSSHFFEHIEQAEALKVFKKIHKILAPNGVFRICCPDIDAFAQQFSHEEKYREAWWQSVWPQRPASISIEDAFVQMGGNADLGPIPSPDVGHVWPQSFGVIFWMLTAAGFNPSRIVRSAYGGSRIDDVRKYNLDNRSNHTFYVEAYMASS